MRKTVLLLCCLLLGCVQDFVLKPAFDTPFTPDQFGYNYHEVNLPYKDNYINIWHIFSKKSDALLVVIPGSDSNKSRYAQIAPHLIEKGLDLILMDYPGFGESLGSKSFQDCVDSARIVVDYALEQHEDVFLFGISLGSPIAARIAADEELSGIILEGTLILWDEVELWIEDNLPLLLLLKDLVDFSSNWTRFQTPPDLHINWWIRFVDEPKLFIHSAEDKITPYNGAVNIFDIASQPKQFWTISGGHGKMAFAEPDLWSQMITIWIRSRIEWHVQT